jgi:hypothetical protein
MRYLLLSTVLAFFVSTAFAEEGCPESTQAVVDCCAGQKDKCPKGWCLNMRFPYGKYFHKTAGAKFTAGLCDGTSASFCYEDTNGGCKGDHMYHCSLATICGLAL